MPSAWISSWSIVSRRRPAIRVALLVISAAMIGGCRTVPPQATVDEQAWKYERFNGRKLVTEHFDIHTTLHDVEFEEALPTFLEDAHRQYASLLPPPDNTSRLQTYVFQTRSEWERFTRLRFPERFNTYRHIASGGFAEGNACVTWYIRRPATLSVLAHEGLHQYVANYFPVPLPAWVNEGLACYCESYELRRNRAVFKPKRNTFRLNALREAAAGEGLIPLRTVLGTDAGTVIVKGRSRLTRTYYAQAWALIAFLRHGPDKDYRDGFDNLLAGIRALDLRETAQAARVGGPNPSHTSYGEAVFRAYITTDLDRFEDAFTRFVYKLCDFRAPPG